MEKILKRIFELIDDEKTDYQYLTNFLKLSDVSVIYAWRRKENLPSTENVVKLSELYDCSLDYLLNRTDDFGKSAIKQVDKFYNRLEELIKKNQVKKYKLENDKICSSNNLFKWKHGAVPKIETLIKLADYFDVSVDYLLGRE